MLAVVFLYDREKNSEPPIQSCCSLRVKEGCLRFRNLPAIFRSPAIFRLFLQLDSTPPPPPNPCRNFSTSLCMSGEAHVACGTNQHRQCGPIVVLVGTQPVAWH